MNAQLAESRPADVAELRVPPHANDAEQAVLGGLMLVPKALSKVSDWLAEDDFYRPAHRAIFRAIVTLIERGSPVDPVTMADWFDANGLADVVGGAAYLVELTDATAGAANIVAYAEIVVERSRRRALIAAGTALAEAAWKPNADAGRIAAEAVHDLAQMQASKLRGALEPAAGAVKKLFATINERYNRGPGLIGIPWPWEGLNNVTNGLQDGVLYIVGARPSMGKSVLGLQTAVAAAMRGDRTAFFSVEMGAEECMGRAMACVGEIPHSWVMHPTDKHEDAEWMWPRLTDAFDKLKSCELLIDETPALSARQMLARARRAHMQKPLRLIVVDHMHDMEVDPRNARFDYGVITQVGKTMAKEFGCPVILLAQLNRAAANRTNNRPQLADLRESGEIEQKADVVLFLHREDYYKPGEMAGVVEVIPAKGRNLRIGESVFLQNVFSEMRLQDWIGPLPAPSHDAKPRRGMR